TIGNFRWQRFCSHILINVSQHGFSCLVPGFSVNRSSWTHVMQFIAILLAKNFLSFKTLIQEDGHLQTGGLLLFVRLL
ncbi:MAG: hypothetical protein AB1Z50_03630, partial [Desulfuromonadales bacterium]